MEEDRVDWAARLESKNHSLNEQDISKQLPEQKSLQPWKIVIQPRSKLLQRRQPAVMLQSVTSGE